MWRPPVSGANASLWRRTFTSGTRAEFDGGNGKGTIHWASGLVQEGPLPNLTALEHGCRFESM
jgi:hypothetical protein